MARAATLDWPIIRETLADGCQLGYAGFISVVSGMNAVYQIQHSRAFNQNITALSQLVDQFKVTTNLQRQQQAMDRELNEDLTRQLNSFTRSVADISEKLESKTLELSKPSARKTVSVVTPPTADSSSSHQREIPGVIEGIPGAKYKSSFLLVEFGPNGDPSLTPTTARAKHLLELGQMKMSTKAVITILNQDLSAILGRCRYHPSGVSSPLQRDPGQRRES